MNFTAENIRDSIFYRPPEDTQNARRTGIALSIDPHARICPRFDETGIALFPLASWGEMGYFNVDNCAEEHIQ